MPFGKLETFWVKIWSRCVLNLWNHLQYVVTYLSGALFTLTKQICTGIVKQSNKSSRSNHTEYTLTQAAMLKHIDSTWKPSKFLHSNLIKDLKRLLGKLIFLHCYSLCLDRYKQEHLCAKKKSLTLPPRLLKIKGPWNNIHLLDDHVTLQMKAGSYKNDFRCVSRCHCSLLFCWLKSPYTTTEHFLCFNNFVRPYYENTITSYVQGTIPTITGGGLQGQDHLLYQ